MRVELLKSGTVKIILSERNLKVMLVKLLKQPKSQRSIGMWMDDGDTKSKFYLINAERNEEHYAKRAPGPMIKSTERLVKALDAALATISEDRESA